MKFQPDKKLHSREHVLADDLSRALGEPKKFAAYLGIARLYYESDLRALLRRIMGKTDLPAEARGKYFFACVRALPKIPGVKFKRVKKGIKSMENIRHIVKEPHSVLRKKASNVSIAKITSPAIQHLIESMKSTLKATEDGVGLAAPQLGEALRIFIISDEAEEIDKADAYGRYKKNSAEHYDHTNHERPYPEREWRYYVFINPVIRKIARKKETGPEGCLSVPGVFGGVKRNEKITVEALDENGKKFMRGASHFFARVIQHELDHLDGILFIDKAHPIIHSLK